jgi:hypothetical protein
LRPDALGRAALRLDQELFEWSARRRSPLLDRALPLLTRAADHGVLWMAVAGGLAVAGGRQGRRAARTGLTALAITSALANQLGKRSFSRRRPLLEPVPLGRRAHRVPISPSFPSGHASAAAFATSVAMMVPATAVPVGALARWPTRESTPACTTGATSSRASCSAPASASSSAAAPAAVLLLAGAALAGCAQRGQVAASDDEPVFNTVPRTVSKASSLVVNGHATTRNRGIVERAVAILRAHGELANQRGSEVQRLHLKPIEEIGVTA